MFCPKCGKNINNNAKFCNFCGNDLSETIQSKKDIFNLDIPYNYKKKEKKTELKKEVLCDIEEKSNHLFCPNPRCHATYKENEQFCIQCGNVYAQNPPINEEDFLNIVSVNYECIYCPECGERNDNDFDFCDCGCDFRLNPKVAEPIRKKVEYFCIKCHHTKVSQPDEICFNCSEAKNKGLKPEPVTFKNNAVFSSEEKNEDSKFKSIAFKNSTSFGSELKNAGLKPVYCSKCRKNAVSKLGDVCQECISEKSLYHIGLSFNSKK